MSPDTPTHSTLDRSSVTPPDRGSSERVRGRFHMKPESAAVQRRMHERKLANLARKLAEDKKSSAEVQSSTPDDIPRVIELDSDDAGAGPLPKDDSVYRDRSVRSRIASVQSTRDSIIRTRRSAARQNTSIQDSQAHTDTPIAQATEEGRSLPTAQRSRNRVKKTPKSAEFVDDDGDEDVDRPETNVVSPSLTPKSTKRSREERNDPTSVKKARQTDAFDRFLATPSPPPVPSTPLPPVPTPPPLSPHAPLPTLADVISGPASFVDDEAEESEHEEGVPMEQDERSGSEDWNEYDLGDPFINDDVVESVDSDSSGPSIPSDHPALRAHRVARPTNARASRRQPAKVLSDEEDDDHTLRRLHRGKRPDKPSRRSPTPQSGEDSSDDSDNRPLGPLPTKLATPKTIKPVPRPIAQRVHSVPVPEVVELSSDTEAPATPGHKRRLAKGKRVNDGKAPAQHVEQFERPARLTATAAPGVQRSTVAPSGSPSSMPAEPSPVAKGKMRARTPSVHSRASDNEESLHLSDMSDWERTQFERAVQESKKTAMRSSAGEPSGQGSSSSASPQELSTPQATALFTTPTNSHRPALPMSPESPTPSATHLTVQELVRRARAAATSSPVPEAPSPTPQASPARPSNRIRLIIRCRPADIPVICEVTHRELWDLLLADQYPLLVHLRAGYLIAWSPMRGPGLVKFSAWADQCPNMNAVVALAAINAHGSGYILNPSRCSPVGVGLYTPPNTVDRYHFYVACDEPGPLTAFSTGLLEHSQLVVPSESGLRQKWVRVIMHSQEWQRYTGFIRMVSGHESLHSQYNRDALQFSTRPLNRSPNNPNGKPYGDSKKKGNGLRVPKSKMFTGNSAVSDNKVSADTFSLSADAVVPVYDARSIDNYDFNASLSRLAETLPVWDQGEIPYGSFVVVGHTLSIYRSSAGNWTLACNLQWVIVVATPDEDDDEGEEEADEE